MALWVIELSEFDVQYHPRTAIKGQIIADFIAEFMRIKGQGQERFPNGVFTQTDRPPSKQVELEWYSIAQKGTRSNVWSDSISLR